MSSFKGSLERMYVIDYKRRRVIYFVIVGAFVLVTQERVSGTF